MARKNIAREKDPEIVDVGSFRKLKFNQFNFTDKQKEFLKLAFDKETKIVFLNGPAGSSKTFLAIYAALQLHSMNRDYDISYVRTIVESAERGLGSLPGEWLQKIDPFLMPMQEKMEEILLNRSQIKSLIENNVLKAVPVNFLRGASWKNKIVIFDESQNASTKELTTFVTRIGENCKLFICGDPMQSDINGKSGFSKIVETFSGYDCEQKGIHVFNFGIEDIMRSEILKFIISKLENINKKQ